MSVEDDKSQPNTPHVVEDLSAYLDGELDRATRSKVEAHLASCDSCAWECRTLQQTKQLLAKAPRVVAPRSFTIRELDVAPQRAPVRLSWGVILARAAAPVVGVMLFLAVAGDVFTQQMAPAAVPAPAAFGSDRERGNLLASTQTPGTAPGARVQAAEAVLTGAPTQAVLVVPAQATPATKSVAPTVVATIGQPTAAPTSPSPLQPSPQPSSQGSPVVASAPSPAQLIASPTPQAQTRPQVGIAAAPSDTPVSSEAEARMTTAPAGKGGDTDASPSPTQPAPPPTATRAPTATAMPQPSSPTSTRPSTPAAEAEKATVAPPAAAQETVTPQAASLLSANTEVLPTDQGASESEAPATVFPPQWAWRVAELGTGGLFIALLLIAVLGGRAGRQL